MTMTNTLKTGLLWFDDAPARTLEAKVLQAADRYRQKFGHLPNLCLVHPTAFNGRKPPCYAGEVEVRPGRTVLPHHLWLGVTSPPRSGGSGDSQPTSQPKRRQP